MIFMIATSTLSNLIMSHLTMQCKHNFNFGYTIATMIIIISYIVIIIVAPVPLTTNIMLLIIIVTIIILTYYNVMNLNYFDSV